VTLSLEVVAEELGLSRGHLAKVVDSGALEVQDDGGVRRGDLARYETRLREARARDAEALAHRDELEDQLLDLID
jgi:hypothetical protein